MDLHRRIRWGNVARAAALVAVVVLVVAWPRLRSEPPAIPPPAVAEEPRPQDLPIPPAPEERAAEAEPRVDEAAAEERRREVERAKARRASPARAKERRRAVARRRRVARRVRRSSGPSAPSAAGPGLVRGGESAPVPSGGPSPPAPAASSSPFAPPPSGVEFGIE
jgi:hypothetical protein